MDIQKTEGIMLRFHAQNPNPKIELEYVNDFTLVVAVLLSAQSTDVGVNKATKVLFKAADSPQKFVQMGLEKLKEYVKTIGLYNNKAKNIIALSGKLIADGIKKIPNNFEYLESLPGIGRKSASVILSTLYNAKMVAVDTHVFRVSNRLGIINAKNVLDAEQKLMDIVPKKFLPQAHQWLVLHGRYVCKAKKPDCQNCFISDFCTFYQNSA